MGPIPEEVRCFADRSIESIDQLEILRVLAENPNKEWDPAFLAAAIQTEPRAVVAHLMALHARGLLVVERRATECVARHGPHTAELSDQVGRLLHFYRERPVSMIKMIYDQAKSPLRNFADAFRLRKGEG
ncbi:MAG TPA: hypothetical protein VGF55_02450 [Gemmataceae bacterium]|jgi:hypothetical protein